MNIDEYKLLIKVINKVLSSSKYRWIIDSDFLLSRQDIQQELLLRYIGLNKKPDNKESFLYVFFSSRLLDIKRDYDRKHNFERDELMDDIPYVDTMSLRSVVKDTLNTLSCVTSNKDVQMLFDFYVYGKTQTEIACELGVSQQYVAKRLDFIVSQNKDFLEKLLSEVETES